MSRIISIHEVECECDNPVSVVQFVLGLQNPRTYLCLTFTELITEQLSDSGLFPKSRKVPQTVEFELVMNVQQQL